MEELSAILSKAREKKRFTIMEFETLVHKIKQMEGIFIDWDEDAGEEWVRFLNVSGEIVLMLNKKIGIVFLRKGNLSTDIINMLKDLYIVEVENYSASEWCLDLLKLENSVPEIVWRADEESIDRGKMSLQDLYYATV